MQNKIKNQTMDKSQEFVILQTYLMAEDTEGQSLTPTIILAHNRDRTKECLRGKN